MLTVSHFGGGDLLVYWFQGKVNMVDDGILGSLTADSLVKRGSSRQNISSYQSQAGQIIEGEKSLMETEGRVFSDFSRNSSEELFLKSLMESSVGMPVPAMDMVGFKNLPQNFRTDSEELFKSWLTNGEASNFTILIHQVFLEFLQVLYS